MPNFIMLVACLIVGLHLWRSGRMPDNAHTVINTVILQLSLPAASLRDLHDSRLDSEALWPVLMALPWVARADPGMSAGSA